MRERERERSRGEVERSERTRDRDRVFLFSEIFPSLKATYDFALKSLKDLFVWFSLTVCLINAKKNHISYTINVTFLQVFK